MSLSEKRRPHYLLFDPVPFNGGSKIASYEIIRQSLRAGVHFTVLTCDPDSWRNTSLNKSQSLSLSTFSLPPKLGQATTGWQFWLKQVYFMWLLSLVLIRTRRVTGLAGLSGPGVDMAVYLCQKLFRLPVMQFIHGPVSGSLSIGYCLTRADKVFYLESSAPSIKQALQRFYDRTVKYGCGEELARLNLHPPHYVCFANGIGSHSWPTQCQYVQPRLFWAASLLKWKGLDNLIEALRLLPEDHPLQSDICYIRPHNIALPQSQTPSGVRGVSWHQQPDDMDQIRARCNIFVSTSTNEPFGLSILEAMAAGHCIVIPQDGAYWDQKLIHNVNCIKYTPGCAHSLAKAIQRLLQDPLSVQRIGLAGYRFSQRYQAEACYQEIIATLSGKAPLNSPSYPEQSYA